jgi:hypothetical protein
MAVRRIYRLHVSMCDWRDPLIATFDLETDSLIIPCSAPLIERYYVCENLSKTRCRRGVQRTRIA